MKFCPNCGAKLKFEDAKFCPECGKTLSESVEAKDTIQKEYDEENLKASIFELGTKLEEVVEKIYRAKGYTTERRQRLMGESGTLSEIDVVAKRGSRTIAIECKNYSYPVGIDKLRDFNQKLQDLDLQGIFIALNGLTEGAAQFAQSQHIETIDSSELMEKWWRISVGRGENVRGQSLTLESALPLNISYLQATRIDLLNREKIRISEAELIFHPYFSIEYLFKARVKDPTRRLHKFEDAGTLFVDALDGRVLNAFPEKGLGLLKAIKRIASETARAENERTGRLLQELRNNEASAKYTVEIKEDYKGNQLKPAITPRQAIEAAMDFIIELDTQEIAYTLKTEEDEIFSQPHYVTYVPKKSDIRILHKDIIVVPRWSIEFEAFNKIYRRELLAFSGIILEDTMQYCPKHFKVGAITLAPRKTIAVCEVCGQSLCDSHVKMCPICRKWLCEEDGIECTVCKNRFCKEHQLLSCSICNKPLCNSCAVVCPICGAKYGVDHVTTCDNCKRNICPNCVIIAGFIRKTRTCKKCATQL